MVAALHAAVVSFASHLLGLGAFDPVEANHVMDKILVQVFTPGIRMFVAEGRLDMRPDRAVIGFGRSAVEELSPSTEDCDRVGHYHSRQSLSSKRNQQRALRFGILGHSDDQQVLLVFSSMFALIAGYQCPSTSQRHPVRHRHIPFDLHHYPHMPEPSLESLEDPACPSSNQSAPPRMT